MMSRTSSRFGRNSGDETSVWIANSNSLRFIRKIADYRVRQNVERTAKKDVVSWRTNNMDLDIYNNVTDTGRNCRKGIQPQGGLTPSGCATTRVLLVLPVVTDRHHRHTHTTLVSEPYILVLCTLV